MKILKRVPIRTTHRCSILVMIVFLLGAGGFAQAKECADYDRSIKYKIILKNITAAESEVFLRIYVEPEKFTIDHMLKLSARLKAEFCNLNRISARFYDVKKVLEFSDPLPNPLPVGEIKTLMRGFYNLDRKKEVQELDFKADKAAKVTSITFKSDGYCVSETDIEEKDSSKQN